MVFLPCPWGACHEPHVRQFSLEFFSEVGQKFLLSSLRAVQSVSYRAFVTAFYQKQQPSLHWPMWTQKVVNDLQHSSTIMHSIYVVLSLQRYTSNNNKRAMHKHNHSFEIIWGSLFASVPNNLGEVEYHSVYTNTIGIERMLTTITKAPMSTLGV